MAKWQESEWADDGVTAYEGGVEADVYPDDRGWLWGVKATAAVSEWPELWDAGSAGTKKDAQDAAERALARAVSAYAANYEAFLANREKEHQAMIRDAYRQEGI